MNDEQIANIKYRLGHEDHVLVAGHDFVFLDSPEYPHEHGTWEKGVLALHPEGNQIFKSTDPWRTRYTGEDILALITRIEMEQVKVDLLKKLRDEQLKVIQDNDLSYVGMRTMMRKYRDRSDRLEATIKAAREALVKIAEKAEPANSCIDTGAIWQCVGWNKAGDIARAVLIEMNCPECREGKAHSHPFPAEMGDDDGTNG